MRISQTELYGFLNGEGVRVASVGLNRQPLDLDDLALKTWRSPWTSDRQTDRQT